MGELLCVAGAFHFLREAPPRRPKGDRKGRPYHTTGQPAKRPYQDNSQTPLAAVAQLSRSFVCLLRLSFLPKGLKCKPFVIVGKSPVGV